MNGGQCSDPLNIGCKREIGGVALSLPNSPHSMKGIDPCQSCRRKRAMLDRERKGLPPWRCGAGQSVRL
jgi:hypothetical protein